MQRLGRVAGLCGLVLLLAGFTSREISLQSLSVAGPSDGATVPAVLGRPDGAGPFRAVVMLPTCLGLSPTMHQDWARVFAAAGYVSIALEHNRPRGMKHCMSNGPKGRPWASWIGDAYAALEYLSKMPEVDISRVAVVGFSMGGITLGKYMAEDIKTPGGHRFKAMASVYAHCNGDKRPGGDPVEGTPRVPWLVLNGGMERIELKGSCGALKGRDNITVELIDGAYHGWDVRRLTTPHEDPVGNVMLYNEAATKKSHAIVLDFLARHLN